MKMYIPPLGTELVLAKAWSFPLFLEYRNIAALEYFKLLKEGDDHWSHEDKSYPHTLPKGTTLKVDRIYIRKGAGDYDSVTFFMPGTGKRIRFWAKLADVNRIEFE